MTTAICCACNVFFSQKRRQGQQRSRASGAKGDEHGNSLSSLDLARRRLERYILDHKVQLVSSDSSLPSSPEDGIMFKRCHEGSPHVVIASRALGYFIVYRMMVVSGGRSSFCGFQRQRFLQ